MDKVFRFIFAVLVSNFHVEIQEEIRIIITFIQNEGLKLVLCPRSKIYCPRIGTVKDKVGFLQDMFKQFFIL